MGKRHKHDMCNTRIYGIWNSMKSRCSDIKDEHHYKHYFSRGITVCGEWKSDFMNFYNWAINNGYSDDLEIDRIDNDGNYEPSNCQCITHKENNNKRGNNRIIKAFGETHTLTEWANKYGMSVDTLSSRLTRGWNIEIALTEPIRNVGKRMWKTNERSVNQNEQSI